MAVRYDGAWDFHSMLEELQRPVAARLGRASCAPLQTCPGVRRSSVLLIAAGLALLCANTPLAPWYHALMTAPFGIQPPGGALMMTVGEWFSEGLLAVFLPA